MKCSKCQVEKQEEEFYIRKDSKKGRTSQCKDCKSQVEAEKRVLKRNGKNKGCIYFKNEEKINEDSLLSWYIAGLFASDGSVHKNCISITLHPKDIETINLVKSFFEYDGPIGFYNKKYPCVRIGGAQRIIEIFENKFNITENKSLTLTPPFKIPSLDHALAYIIGYLDGDGCIYLNKKSKMVMIHFLGTEEILEFISNIFSKFCDFDLKPRKSSSPSEKVKQIGFWIGRKNSKYKNLIEKLLSIDVPKMDRKWNIISDFLAEHY